MSDEIQPKQKSKFEISLKDQTIRLKSEIEDLAESLSENRNDKWFDNPRGWLLGPGEKRGAHVDTDAVRDERFNSGKNAAFISTPYYTKRWFVLDSHNKTLKYYKDEHTRIESGCIDMTTVIDIQACSDPFAPMHAFDLVGRGGRCSLAAQTHEDVIRWCYACDDIMKRLDPIAKSDLSAITSAEGVAARNSPRDDDEKRWFRYSYTFSEAGPLMLNVVGLTDQDSRGVIQSHWLLVTSFARHPDGRIGSAERSGVIKVKDYIVGVNNVDLTALPYHEAMAAMRNAVFPKTVYFLRDLNNKADSMFIDGWAYVYYTALHKRRKRYIELDSENINFRKPTVSGSTSSKRDCYFAIDQISHIQPMTDHNYIADSQYSLHIYCQPGAQLSLLGNDDLIIGTAPINTIILYFKDNKELQEWIKFLSTSSLRPRRIGGSSIGDIPITEAGIIEKNDKELSYIDILGIKSAVTNKFTLREFSISDDGFLIWKPVKSISDNKYKKESTRRILLANNLTCPLRGVYAGEDDTEDPEFRYQLIIQDVDQTVWIGMSSEELCRKWMELVIKTVEKSPEDSRENLMLPFSILAMDAVYSIMAENNIDEDETYLDEVPDSARGRTSSLFNFLTPRTDTANSPRPEPDDGAPRRGTIRASLSSVGGSSKRFSNVGSESDKNNNGENSARGRKDTMGRVVRAMSSLTTGKVQQSIEEDYSPGVVQGYLYYKHNSKLKSYTYSRYWFSLKVEGVFKLFYYGDKRIITEDSEGNPISNTKAFGYIDLLELLEVRESIEIGAPVNTLDLVTPTRIFQLTAPNETQCLKWYDAILDALELRPMTSANALAMGNMNYISKADRIQSLKREIFYEGSLSMKNVSVINFVTWKAKYFVISKGSFYMFDRQDEVFTSENNKEILSIHAVKYVESSKDIDCPPGCAFDVHAFVGSGGGYDGSKIFTFEAQTPNLCKEWMSQICAATGKFILTPKPRGDGYHSVVERDIKSKVEKIGKQYVRANEITENNNPSLRNPNVLANSTAGNTTRQSTGGRGGMGRGSAFLNAGRGGRGGNMSPRFASHSGAASPQSDSGSTRESFYTNGTVTKTDDEALPTQEAL